VAGLPTKDKCNEESNDSFEPIAYVLAQLGRYAAFITVIFDRLSHDILFFYGGDNHMMNRKDRRRRVGYNSSHA
jgi:hypothetical protein